MKRIIKIISIILVICLIMSLYIQSAYAITPEIVAISGGLAGIIGILIGIKYIADITPVQFNSMIMQYAPQIADATLLYGNMIQNPIGTTSLFINKAFFDWLKGINSNIITEESIQDYDSGIFGNYGSILGVPITEYNNNIFRSNRYVVPQPVGEIGWIQKTTGYGLNTPELENWSSFNSGAIWYIQYTNGFSNARINIASSSANVSSQYIHVNRDGINIEYETDGIDLTIGEDLPDNGGAVITIPESGFTDIESLIERIIEKYLEQEVDEIDIELVSEEPIPDYGPLISDTPFIDLIGLFRHLEQEIEEVFVDTVGSIAEVIEDIGTDIIGLFGDLETWIADTIGAIGETIEDVGQDIIGIGESVIETVESIDLSIDSIVEGISDIAEKIETGIIELFQGFIQGLNRIFNPILLRIKSALSIWHYVVEWLQSVGGVFTWIFGIASQTSYYIVLPIYASIAAAITIAIYKRFGR